MSSDYVSKDDLFVARLPESDVQVRGVGTVRVRGLTRAEVFRVQGIESTVDRDRVMISLGMLTPRMTESDVNRWIKATDASELEPVSLKIGELSGLLPSQPKEVMQAFRDEPID